MKDSWLCRKSRKGSYNRSLLRSAIQLLSSDTTLEIFDLSDIPPYNQDLDNNMPPKVKKFKTKISESDALLIATPEYNYSVPGVLKNAIDYASRPYGDNSFEDKPVAIMSASVGMIGGARTQYHRQMFVFLNMHPVNVPEVIVTFASDKLDSEGNLLDYNTKKFLKNIPHIDIGTGYAIVDNILKYLSKAQGLNKSTK